MKFAHDQRGIRFPLSAQDLRLHGTLYGTIKRLIQDGLIEESDERPAPDRDDERRRYCRLTGIGATVARLEAKRLEAVVRSARRKKLLGLTGASA